MNFYLLAAALSGLLFAVSGVIYKISNKHLVKDPLRYIFWFQTLRTLTLLVVFPLIKVSFVPQLWFYFGLYSLSFFLGTVLTGLALVDLDASVFMPLFNLQIILTPLIAFFFLGEKLSFIQYLLMSLILLGGLLVTYSENSRRRRSVVVSLAKRFFHLELAPFGEKDKVGENRLATLLVFTLGLVFYSFSDNFAGRLLRGWDVVSLIFFGSFLQFLFSFLLLPFIKTSETVNFRRLGPILLGSAFGLLALMAINTGFSYNVSLSQALSRLSSVYALAMVIVLARFKGDLLEKHPFEVYLVRFLGASVMVLSALGLLIVK